MTDADPVTRLNAALEGRYRIESELGEGGMATVYLADDIKHERKVALKVLKPELAAVVGAERFLAEIKTTANLTHPHILPLHDSGEADGFLYYVMPYIEGETLRERIDRDRQLPVDEALGIATAIANALHTAHEQGVVHRDIKPGNILMSRGEPLVADFGIALAVSAGGGGRLTETGLSLGTPYYMSPEQATGDQTVGPASDTFALACVLYEMLVGDPPYPGSTAQAVLGKIIQGLPVSATAIRQSVPANVDAAIRKALEKLPADRFPSAQDFVRALGDPGFRYGEIAVTGAGVAAGPWNRLALAGWGAAAVLTLALGWSLFGESGPVRHTLRYAIPLPKEGESEGLYFHYHLSPDGQYFAVSGVIAQAGGIFVRALNSFEWRYLSGTKTGDFFWSRDSRSLAFSDNQKLRRVDVGGGAVQDIADIDLEDFLGQSGTWSRDGVIVFEERGTTPRSRGDRLFSVPASGGEPLALTTVEPGVSHRYPAFLPDGQHFLYTSEGGSNPGIYVASLDDPVGLMLLPDPSSAVFAPGVYDRGVGHLIFVRDGRLMAQPFDPSALEFRGEAFVLAERALWGDSGAAAVSVSDNGILTYLGGRNRETDSRLVWFDRSGSALASEGSTGPPSPVSLSPDERMAAVVRGGTDGDVWLRDLERGLEAPFTFDSAVTIGGNVVWSPDGSRIAFSSAASESVGLYIADVTASGTGEPIFANGNTKILTDWSRDGYLLYTEIHPETWADLWYLRMDGSATGGGEPVPFRTDQFATSFGQISPDGQWIAYVSNETGSFEVWVQPFPSGAGRWRISAAESNTGDSAQPRWSRDGSELFYVKSAGSKGTMMVARVRTPPDPGSSPVVDPQPLFDVRANSFAPFWGTSFYDVSGDGERFLINQVETATEPVINVVVNWEEEVRQRVPN